MHEGFYIRPFAPAISVQMEDNFTYLEIGKIETYQIVNRRHFMSLEI